MSTYTQLPVKDQQLVGWMLSEIHFIRKKGIRSVQKIRSELVNRWIIMRVVSEYAGDADDFNRCWNVLADEGMI